MEINELKTLLNINAPVEDLVEAIRKSPSTPGIMEVLRALTPDLSAIPLTTYTQFRQFERNGDRDRYQAPHFQRRNMLTRGVMEMVMGDLSFKDAVQDLLWIICDETSWVLPAHEEQGPNYWDINPPIDRQTPLTSHTMLTREPDSIDLFAAETGSNLAETLFLVGQYLDPEVCLRVRQEVERRIFKPYLAYGRNHWWFKGALNWNGVCNGSIGLAFMRLEKDPQTLAEAISMVLEGFNAYIQTGFEPDGGSIEGIGYWNYGLMYFVTLAELLRERTGGKLDLLSNPQLKKIAHYPFAVALSPGLYVAFGDATEHQTLEPGIVSRLVQKTGVKDLLGLLTPANQKYGRGLAVSKLSILVRDAAWWDGNVENWPEITYKDHYLPESGVIKLAGKSKDGKNVALVAKAGHNDGHHSHTDVGAFVYHIGGESLLVDPGRGHYSKEYFRKPRYQNLFCNSLGHSVPRIDDQLQAPGPEFGGKKEFFGTIISTGQIDANKFAVIDIQKAYSVKELHLCRRKYELDAFSGVANLEDHFIFEKSPLTIEEALITWADVKISGTQAEVIGKKASIMITVNEPTNCQFEIETFEQECRENHFSDVLKRLVVRLPLGCTKFKVTITPRQ